MIVIPTFDGGDLLTRCLQGFELWGTSDHEILVVDTGTTDPKSIETLGSLQETFPTLPIKLEASEFGGYELGAIRHAWYNYHPEHLLLIHDSMSPNVEAWWLPFKEKFDSGNDVVPWITLAPMMYDTILRPGFVPEVFITEVFQVDPYAIPFVILGSIFCATSEALTKVEKASWLSMPCLHKEESRAWERGWTAVFQKVAAKMSPIMTMEILPSMRRIESGEKLPCFDKVLARRL